MKIYQPCVIIAALLCLSPQLAGGASYTCQTNAEAEQALNRALATTHSGQSKQSIMQGFATAGLIAMKAGQDSQDAALNKLKIEWATQAAKDAANAALNAGITPPTLEAIGNQTTVQGTPVSIDIVTADVNNASLVLAATGLPPGIALLEGKLQGTPTTLGTFQVTVRAFKAPDIQATPVTFQWSINAP